MAFVTTKEMLKEAQKGRYGIGAFNANNMEIIQAIIETAEEEKAPVILQASQGAIKYAGLDSIVAMVKVIAERATIPVALHLDHGTDYYIPVEAELGQIGKMGDSDEPGVTLEKVKESMAVPEEALKFVELTEIDFLAAAVGTIHGCRTPFAKLDIPRIEKIRELTGVPLVLHGASGANDEEVRKGIAAGICKINIDTRIRLYFVKKMREVLGKNPEEIDPRKILGPAKEAAKEIIRDRIKVFGCSGKV